MQATLAGRAIAESVDIVECAGYAYFPNAAVRIQGLAMAPVADRFGFWEEVLVC